MRKEERPGGLREEGGSDRRGEGRLRLHEGSKSPVPLLKDIRANPENPNSLMANLNVVDHPDPRHQEQQQQQRQRPSLNPDKPTFVARQPPRQAGTSVESVALKPGNSSAKDTKVKNPFEEDVDYDETLNPFADEDTGGAIGGGSKKAPAKDKDRGKDSDADSYDESLNPFA